MNCLIGSGAQSTHFSGRAPMKLWLIFCDKFPHKNPETYLNFRNQIIKLYRENP
jgi:hypothetical protein